MKRVKNTIIFLILVMLVGTIIAPSNVSAKTMYYRASHMKGKDTYKSGRVGIMKLQSNKLVTKGSFQGTSKKSQLYGNKTKYYKYKKRTFKLANNIKFYSEGGLAGKQRLTRSDVLDLCNNANGLEVVIKVKNGRVVSLTFGS